MGEYHIDLVAIYRGTLVHHIDDRVGDTWPLVDALGDQGRTAIGVLYIEIILRWIGSGYLKGGFRPEYGGGSRTRGDIGEGIGAAAPRSLDGDQGADITAGLHIIGYGYGRGVHSNKSLGARAAPRIGILDDDLIIAWGQTGKAVGIGNGPIGNKNRPFHHDPGIRILKADVEISRGSDSRYLIGNYPTSIDTTGNRTGHGVNLQGNRPPYGPDFLYIGTAVG